MGDRPDRSPLTDILLGRIARQGPLTFAAFMEACLYHPEHGYYTSRVPARGRRDYVTSPGVSPLFGRLLARQVCEMWEAMGRPAAFDLVEAGAGAGELAEQMIGWARARAPGFFHALRVTLVEASPGLRAQARERLQAFEKKLVLAETFPGAVEGCLLSNELVDALPVHRVVQREQGLREIYVTARGGALAETEGDLSTPAIAGALERYGAPLEEGQQAEVSLAAVEWLERAAAVLRRGFLLTIDYGYRARELYGPAHPRGTLLAFREHRAGEDWLVRPGEQDLTARVNFTALEKRGEELGLKTLGYVTQAQFLLALARAGQFAELPPESAGQAEQRAARQQLKYLINPEGMGEAFKVLIQARGLERIELSGLGGY